MRAREPDRRGYATSHGVPVYWEEHGAGPHAVLFLPPWQIVHGQIWKMQVPYLAHHFRVLVYDPPGNGRSGRPASGYDLDRAADDALAVLDATGTAGASLVGLSRGAWPAVILAARQPERVERLVLVAGGLDEASRGGPAFHAVRDRDEGGALFNAHYWRAHFREFLERFFGQAFSEPHSTKPIEDGIGWGLGTTPEILIATIDEYRCRTPLADLLAGVHCPTLLLHGTEDRVRPIALSERAHAAIEGSAFVPLAGSGHAPQVRDPVRFNLLVRDFLAPDRPSRGSWRRAASRPRRALFVSSPIGLGHALRDVAIAEALRESRPDLEVHWLAQDPVTRVLESRGETVHPASRLLAGESAHLESEAGEHDLHAFFAWRSMDEILLANFMVLHDLLEAEPYDLVVGDEAWDVDHYLHENPELKRTAFAWLTDFVGWLPLDPDPASREARLAADHNAEMLEQVARFPRVRDRALFVGRPEDVVDAPFGPGLPRIREWTRAHFAFPGYILPFDPAALADREGLRARLGFRPDERVVFAAVGGTAVGRHLLTRVVAAWPHARRLVPDLRLVVVTGPRIDPAALPPAPGLDYRGFVPDLYAHLAACDLAVVQGGLSTCMELTALRRPFLYVPLRRHFEQQIHVPHRLARYRAGVRLAYEETEPEALARAIADGLKCPVLSAEVETDGARRAAELIGQLL